MFELKGHPELLYVVHSSIRKLKDEKKNERGKFLIITETDDLEGERQRVFPLPINAKITATNY